MTTKDKRIERREHAITSSLLHPFSSLHTYPAPFEGRVGEVGFHPSSSDFILFPRCELRKKAAIRDYFLTRSRTNGALKNRNAKKKKGKKRKRDRGDKRLDAPQRRRPSFSPPHRAERTHSREHERASPCVSVVDFLVFSIFQRLVHCKSGVMKKFLFMQRRNKLSRPPPSLLWFHRFAPSPRVSLSLSRRIKVC